MDCLDDDFGKLVLAVCHMFMLTLVIEWGRYVDDCVNVML